MISVVGRSHPLASAFKATAQVVPTSTKEIIVGFSKAKEVSPCAKPLGLTLRGAPLRVSSGIGASTHVRCAHTDFQVPDFSDVRRRETLKPNQSSQGTVEQRNAFTYLIGAGALVLSTYSAKTLVTQVILGMAPSADVLALSKIEINTNDIPEGRSMTFKWRGKPIFVKHRTDEEVAIEEAVDLSTLRDPEHDNKRVNDPKFLVVIGVCTHLGCVPIADAGDYGGYYCPCHGSHYDGSGRIRKGPAPLNLEVPIHSFPQPGLLVVG